MPDSVSVLPRIGENWKPCIYCCLPVTLHCDGICNICTTIEESRFRERENKKRKTSPMVSATATAVTSTADAPAGTEIVGPIENGPVNKKPKLSLPPSIPKPANGVFETDEDLYAYIRENRERRWKFRGSFVVVADPKVSKNDRIDTVFGALRKKARVSFKRKNKIDCSSWAENGRGEHHQCGCRTNCGGWVVIEVYDVEEPTRALESPKKERVTVDIRHWY